MLKPEGISQVMRKLAIFASYSAAVPVARGGPHASLCDMSYGKYIIYLISGGELGSINAWWFRKGGLTCRELYSTDEAKEKDRRKKKGMIRLGSAEK